MISFRAAFAVFIASVASVQGTEHALRGAGNAEAEGGPPEESVQVWDSGDEWNPDLALSEDFEGPEDSEGWGSGDGAEWIGEMGAPEHGSDGHFFREEEAPGYSRFLVEESASGEVLNEMLKDGWRNLSTDMLSDLVLEEVKSEVRANGTFDGEKAVLTVLDQILAKTPDELRNDTEAMEKLIDDVVERAEFPEGKNNFDKPVLKAGGKSVCHLDGEECTGPEYERKAETVIVAMLEENKRQGKHPDMEAIYKRLDSDLGMTAEEVDDVIEGNPELSKHLEAKVVEVEKKAVEIEVEEKAEKIKTAFKEGVENLTSVAETLDALGMKMEDVSAVIDTAKNETSEAILQAMAKPEEHLQNNIEKVKLIEKEDNHTYFEDTGEEDVDEESGQRRRILKFNAHPRKLSIEDHIKAAHDRSHQRRLSLDRLPADTSDLRRRLTDHSEELQGRVRELLDASLDCDPEETKTRCVANGLEKLNDEVNENIPKVLAELDPLDTLLGHVRTGGDILDLIVKIATVTYYAVYGASKVPKFGKPFVPVKVAMKPVLDLMKKIEKKIEQFIEKIGKVWEDAIGMVEGLLKSFNEGSIGKAIQVTKVVATVGESQCLSGLVNHVAGFDLISGVEIPAFEISKYLGLLSVALGGLMDVFGSMPWKMISVALNTIVLSMEPIRDLFAPFQPLIDIMKQKVEIKPWFNVPYSQKRLGDGRCDSGFHFKMDGRSCWENNSRNWEQLVPKVMAVTCENRGMHRRWGGTCSAYRYGRHYQTRPPYCYSRRVPYPKTCRGRGHRCVGRRWWRHCFHYDYWYPCTGHKWVRACISYAGGCPWHYSTAWWSPRNCVSNCAGGYYGYFGSCYRHCSYGFRYIYPGVCVRMPHGYGNFRVQQTRWPTCNHVSNAAAENTHAYFNKELGKCLQSCPPGETSLLGQCLPPAVLRISINDIFDAFDFLVKLYEKHPVIKLVLKGIKLAVEPLLAPFVALVDGWLKKILGLTDFPEINANILPFDAFKDLGFTLPELPDASFIADLPKNLWDGVLGALPVPINYIFGCGTDLRCILPNLSNVEIPDVIDPVLKFLVGIEKVFDALEQLGSGVGCGQWSKVPVPFSDIMTKVGLPDISACDAHVHWCSKPDFSNLIEPLKVIQDAIVEPAIKIVEDKVGGRRLLSDGEDKYFHLLSFPLNAVGKEAEHAEILRNWEGFAGFAGSEKEPIANHVRVELDRSISIGLLLRGGEWSLGLSASGGLRARVLTILGAKGVLAKAIEVAEEVTGFAEVLESEYSWCLEDPECSDTFEETQAHLEGAEKEAWPANALFTMQELEKKLYEVKSENQGTDDAEAVANGQKAVAAIKFWFGKRKELEDLLLAMNEFKTEDVEVASDETDEKKSKLMKLSRFVPTLESEGIMDLIGVDLGPNKKPPPSIVTADSMKGESGDTKEWQWKSLIDEFQDSAHFTFGVDAEGLGPHISVTPEFFYEHFTGGDWKDALNGLGGDALSGLTVGSFDLPESLIKGDELEKARDLSLKLKGAVEVAKKLKEDTERFFNSTSEEKEKAEEEEAEALKELEEKKEALKENPDDEEAQTAVQAASEKLEKLNMATEKLAKILFNTTLETESAEKAVEEAEEKKEKTPLADKFLKFVNGLDKGFSVAVAVNTGIVDSKEWFDGIAGGSVEEEESSDSSEDASSSSSSSDSEESSSSSSSDSGESSSSSSSDSEESSSSSSSDSGESSSSSSDSEDTSEE